MTENEIIDLLDSIIGEMNRIHEYADEEIYNSNSKEKINLINSINSAIEPYVKQLGNRSFRDERSKIITDKILLVWKYSCKRFRLKKELVNDCIRFTMETRRILIDNGFYLDFRYEGLILSNILFVLLDVLNESLLSKTIDTLSQLSTLKIVISSKNIEDKNFFEYTEDLILRKISNGNLNQSRIQQEVSFAKHLILALSKHSVTHEFSQNFLDIIPSSQRHNKCKKILPKKPLIAPKEASKKFKASLELPIIQSPPISSTTNPLIVNQYKTSFDATTEPLCIHEDDYFMDLDECVQFRPPII